MTNEFMHGEVKVVVNRRKGLKRVTMKAATSTSVSVSAPYFISISHIKELLEGVSHWLVSACKQTAQREESEKKSKGEYIMYKETARNLVASVLPEVATHYAVAYKRVSIKNTKTRWGSCSSRGNLNFSYKLALLPQHLLYYIVVHEVCHLRELNHSEAFWNLVAEKVSDYQKCKKELMHYALGEQMQSDTL
jgi:predicted metal-dependent hydrolase